MSELRARMYKREVARLREMIIGRPREDMRHLEDAFREGYVRGVDEDGSPGWWERADRAWKLSRARRGV